MGVDRKGSPLSRNAAWSAGVPPARAATPEPAGRRRSMRRCAALLAASACGCSAFDPEVGGLEPPTPAATGTATSGLVDFGRDIRPLMSRVPVPPPAPQGCARCHYSTMVPHPGIDIGGLDLTTL